MTEQATFAVNIGGDFQQGSLANADAADKLAAALDEDVIALRAMQGALRNLKSGNLEASEEAKQLKLQIAAQKAVIGSTQQELLKFGDAWKRNRKGSKDSAIEFAAQARSMSTFMDQIAGSNTTLGAFLSKTQSLSGQLGKAGLAGALALVVVGFAAVTAAIVAANVALASYALRVVEARQAEMIRLEGLTKLPNWFGIAAGKAGDMKAAIDRVSASYALGRDKIAQYTETLYRMGFRGRNLDQVLEGVTIRASVLGEEMGQAFASMAMGAVLTGQSIKGMVDKTKAQFGELAQRQMLSFSVQLRKARENIDGLFANVKISSFLKGFAEINRMLSQSSVEGRALKAIIESMLNPLFGASEKGAPVMKRLFQGMILGALDLAIAVARLRLWWRDTFGEMRTGINWTTIAVYAGIGAFTLMALTVAGLTAAVATFGAVVAFVFGAQLLTIGLPFVLLGAAIWAVIAAVKKLFEWVDKLRNFLGANWREVGVAISHGLTDPLSGIGDIGFLLGRKMVQGFKDAWGIRSPSAVARRMVRQDIAAGATRGADEGGRKAGYAIGKAFMPSMGAGDYGRSAAFAARASVDARAGGSVSSKASRLLQVIIQNQTIEVKADDGSTRSITRAAKQGLTELLSELLHEMGGSLELDYGSPT